MSCSESCKVYVIMPSLAKAASAVSYYRLQLRWHSISICPCDNSRNTKSRPGQRSGQALLFLWRWHTVKYIICIRASCVDSFSQLSGFLAVHLVRYSLSSFNHDLIQTSSFLHARLDKKAKGQFSSLCFLFGYNILPFLVILAKVCDIKRGGGIFTILCGH